MSRHSLIVVLIAFFAFIVIGFSSGILGVAWPDMRDEFGLQDDGMGVFQLIQTSSYIVLSFLSGRVIASLRNGRAFVLFSVVMSLGLIGLALAPSWALVLVCSFVLGSGMGVIDAGLNNYLALYGTALQMNWLHACFGIGTTFMPLVMNILAQNALSWRWGYAVVGVLGLIAALLVILTLKMWRDDIPKQANVQEQIVKATMTESLSQPLVWLSVLLFVVYGGGEMGIGNWAYTLLYEGRGFTEDNARFWVSVFWGLFTIGRIVFGIVAGRMNINTVIRGGMIGSIIGIALIWWNPVNEVGFAGLAIFGFAQAPLFPLLILGTAERMGASHVANAVGLQIAGAGIGIAVIPGIAGVLSVQFGLNFLPAFFFLVVVLVLVIYEIAMRLRPTMPALAVEAA